LAEGQLALVDFRYTGFEVFIGDVRNIIHVVKKDIVHFGCSLIDVSRDRCVNQKEGF
jgi:hypothetical protein|tara:strand:- start:808 stop:978 length:171 start_codon:yes stop_codon:yes gene_type:complete